MAMYLRPMLFRWYHHLSRKQGLGGLFAIISFDCDTAKDAEALNVIQPFLFNHGLASVLAVPGELLLQDSSIYKKLASKSNIEFINHGYKNHTTLTVEGEYISHYFYDMLSKSEVIDDIRKGHDAVSRITDKQPIGFRVPHFGSFQKAKQLDFLHSTLKEMNYEYSTSTLPSYGFINGPMNKRRFGLYEIPVSGCFDWPLKILDSWSFLYEKKRFVGPNDYIMQLKKMVDYFKGRNYYGVLNYYVDPSQVVCFKGFYECLEYMKNNNVTFVTYQQLLSQIESHINIKYESC